MQQLYTLYYYNNSAMFCVKIFSKKYSRKGRTWQRNQGKKLHLSFYI